MPFLPAPFELRRGDSDAARRWGGAVREVSATYVADLQRALVAVGAGSGTPDGSFSAHTEDSLKRFQWHLQNVPVRLAAGGQCTAGPLATGPIADGVLGSTTAQALASFVNGSYTCAGPLVRVAFADLPRLRPAPGFKQLIKGFSGMVVDREFADMLTAMNQKAQTENLYVQVNQVFRIEGVAVNSPVVPPAGHSAHKLGRAIDMQLGSSATAAAAPSSDMAGAASNTPMGRFREHMKALGCRHGASFNPPDPPHYDTQIFPVTGFEWRTHFYFAQRQYSGQPGGPGTRIPVP